ncbi:MAG: hypothetical protein ACK52K_01255 [Alphaproteobacteria bacterium]
MLLTMFGVPTALTDRGVRVVRALAQATIGAYDFIAAGSPEELSAAWARLSTRSVVFHHESPSGGITSFFRKAQAPILLFLDDPFEVACALHRERGVPIMDAMRATSLCLSALEDIVLGNNVLVIDARIQSQLSLRSFVQLVSKHFSLPASDLTVMSVMSSLRHDGVLGQSAISDDPWSLGLTRGGVPELTREQLDVVETCLEPYRRILERQAVQHVHWPAGAFMSMDHGGRPAVGLFDMTGKRRIFFYGPYLGLPPGKWVARVEFEVANNRMGCVMQVNAIAKDFLTQGRIVLPEQGRHFCTIPFETVEPRWPVEIHFTLDQGVLEGEFGLIDVNIERLTEERVATQWRVATGRA